MEKEKQPLSLPEIWQNTSLRITDEFPSPPIVLRVDDSIIGTLGNFSASTGKAKSKKTFNICAIVASALTNGTVLNYRATLPENKRKIIYIDTEQSKFHCKRVLKRILTLAEIPDNEHPENLKFNCLRRLTPQMRLSVIENAIYNTENLGLVVIDGLRDLAYDINSPSESTNLITKLMQWTDERQIHIHTVLHLNKGDDNTRGHLGTELNNKAETVLQITKDEFDKDISSVTAMYIRDIDFEPFAFRINENSLPELVEDYQPKKSEKKQTFDYREVSEEKHREALAQIFSVGNNLSYNNLIERIRSCYSSIGYECGMNKAKKIKQFLSNKRMILQSEDKRYCYNPDFYY
ncbi:mobilization protein [Bacteroidia bacterium]|nr:mobilization protein [Bacteroidia bacterium]